MKVYRCITTRTTSEEDIDKVPKFNIGDHVNTFYFGGIEEGTVTDVRYSYFSDYGEGFDYMINDEWTPESSVEPYSPDNITF